ncbi:hypothetical protein AWB82_01605 [Caballeronia glebae]|uniref:Uncharacterized protein n=1 Tax=Caballeronia glebae TaxID=1777143 RepID=A0A158A2D6_9BURK|nr:hypothetical protein AWB82_01605 [Caballeronia glebae]
MWVSAHKGFVTLFAAITDALLNKVIHRPVESIGNPKIIGGLQTILMFHFNFPRLKCVRVPNRDTRGRAR